MEFDHRTLEVIRSMVIERVRSGERASAVIASYRFSHTTIYKWMTAAAQPGAGTRALYSKPVSGRPRSLAPRQERRVFVWVNGKDPRQYGLDFGLWTRRIVADLIERKFGIRLGLTAVGELLAMLELTPQKPLHRAYQRDPEAIERWRCEIFPSVARKAREGGGDDSFWDESGFRADAVHGKTRGVKGWRGKGQTPFVERPGQRQSISAASAVNSKEAFWYCTYRGGLTAGLFVALLKKMMQRRSEPVHLVVNGLPAHKTALVRYYVASTNGLLTLHFLPGYAPELNPDELVREADRRGASSTPQRRAIERQGQGPTCIDQANTTVGPLVHQGT